MSKVENIHILGYLEMYLFLEFEDGSVTVCKNTMDFEKEIRQNAFDLFANASIAFYEEKGLKVAKIGYITKEQYDQINSALGDVETTVVEWEPEE